MREGISIDDRGVIRGCVEGGRLVVDLDRDTFERLREVYREGNPGNVAFDTFAMNYASLESELRVEGERVDLDDGA